MDKLPLPAGIIRNVALIFVIISWLPLPAGATRNPILTLVIFFGRVRTIIIAIIGVCTCDRF